jgi:hypothetical protein
MLGLSYRTHSLIRGETARTQTCVKEAEPTMRQMVRRSSCYANYNGKWKMPCVDYD